MEYAYLGVKIPKEDAGTSNGGTGTEQGQTGGDIGGLEEEK
jgi:hypothetical protein